jgi:hypothetical protein
MTLEDPGKDGKIKNTLSFEETDMVYIATNVL